MSNRFALDPKHFKHVSSDKEKTVLQHKAGHQVTIAHKTLSKDMRAQLEALIPQEEKEGKKACGGPVKMAMGGMTDEEDDNPTDPALLPQEPVTFDTTPQEPPLVPPEYTDVNALATNSPALASMPESEDTVARQLATDTTQSPGSTSSFQPDLSIPGSTGILPNTDPYMAEAKAIGVQGKAEVEAFKRRKEAELKLDADFKSKFDTITQEQDQLVKEYGEGQIDPNQYWTGKNGQGGHSKVMAAIGMVLAGFGGVQGVNAVSNFLNKQIDDNINAQKENFGKTKTLLEANFKKYGNMREALTASRLALNDALVHDLKIAESQAKLPLAKAAAQQQMQKLIAQRVPMMQELAIGQMVGQMRSGKMSPDETNIALERLDTLDPKRAKALREVYVPGVGFANSLEGAKTTREMQATLGIVKEGVNRLREITKQTGKSLNPKIRAEADTIRNSLVGRLRVPITGPGAMSEGERELLMNMIPATTNLFSLDSSTLKRLDAIDTLVQSSFANTARVNGLNVPDAEVLKKGPDGKMYRKQGKYMVPVN